MGGRQREIRVRIHVLSNSVHNNTQKNKKKKKKDFDKSLCPSATRTFFSFIRNHTHTNVLAYLHYIIVLVKGGNLHGSERVVLRLFA